MRTKFLKICIALSLVFISGLLLGLILGDDDLLTEDINKSVILLQRIDIVDREKSSDVMLSLPKGFVVNFRNKYQETGMFSIDFQILDPTVYEEVGELHHYAAVAPTPN